MGVAEQRRDPIVVEQSSSNVNVIWGFLTIAFGFALWRGHQGAETGTGRLALDVLLGAALLLSVAGWISFQQAPFEARDLTRRDLVVASRKAELGGPSPDRRPLRLHEDHPAGRGAPLSEGRRVRRRNSPGALQLEAGRGCLSCGRVAPFAPQLTAPCVNVPGGDAVGRRHSLRSASSLVW